MSMIEAKFHLFQIQEKVATPDSIVAPQLVLGERPKTLNTVDVVLLSRELAPAVVDSVVPVSVGEEAVVRAKRVRVDCTPLRNLLLDNEPEDSAGDIWYRSCVDSAITLEKPEYSDFSSCAPASIPLAMSSEVAFINLNLSREWGFPLTFCDNSFANKIVDPFCAMTVGSNLSCSSDRWYLQGEEADELAYDSVGKSTAFDKFLSHEFIIQRSNI